MYPRTNYEMAEEDLATLMESIKPTPMIMLQCGSGPSQQDRANSAWETLGKKMGFDFMTVRPDSKGNRFFTAVPSETEAQRGEREQREQAEKENAEIEKLESEILERQNRLAELRPCKGIALGDGNFSGCTATGGDCPECGK
jgi:hypothetical protein